MLKPAALFLVIVSVLATVPLPGDEIRFKKTHVHRKFISEGVAVADVDGDGKTDILAGAYWFQAPEWKPHEVTTPQEFFPTRGYSDTFLNYADDLNGDGRPELLVVGFPGKALRVYENPGRPGGHWKRWDAASSVANESPMYTDVDGDGKRELLCGSNPHEGLQGKPEERWIGWFEVGAWKEPWKWHAVDGPNSPGGHRFSHGIGHGDINGDGRDDILIARGWYEAPASKADAWKLHAFPAGQDGFRDFPSAQMYVYDVDADGDNDIIASSAHALGIHWYEQYSSSQGARGWRKHAIHAESLPRDKWFTQTHSLILADMNRDGVLDIVTGKRWYAHQGHDLDGRNPIVPIYWFELRRRGGKARWIAHLIDDNCGVGTQFAVADINGDGRLDIAVSNKKGVYYLEQQ